MRSRIGSALSLLGREALRIVLPAWCVVCRSELPWRDRTASCCGDCWSSLPKITAPKCNSCAQPLPAGGAAPLLCLSCMADPLPVDWCEAWGEYRGALERLVHALKFERHDFLDDALAGLLADVTRDCSFDAVACVPMQRAKERRRGYNQAELLARALARRLGLPFELTLLRAARGRGTQSQLARRDRAANVKGAFLASTAANGRRILVVDDVCTTGATLRACATALRKAGAERVCAVVVAKTV